MVCILMCCFLCTISSLYKLCFPIDPITANWSNYLLKMIKKECFGPVQISKKINGFITISLPTHSERT